MSPPSSGIKRYQAPVNAEPSPTPSRPFRRAQASVRPGRSLLPPGARMTTVRRRRPGRGPRRGRRMVAGQAACGRLRCWDATPWAANVLACQAGGSRVTPAARAEARTRGLIASERLEARLSVTGREGQQPSGASPASRGAAPEEISCAGRAGAVRGLCVRTRLGRVLSHDACAADGEHKVSRPPPPSQQPPG